MSENQNSNQGDTLTLTLEQLKEANTLLTRGGEGMNIFAVHGYLTAVASSPTDIPAKEWLPVTLGIDSSLNLLAQKNPILNNEEDTQKIILVLHNMREQILAVLKSKNIFFPLVSLENLRMKLKDAPVQNVQDWCNGYLHGVDTYLKDWSSKKDVFVHLVPFAVIAGAYPYEELVQGLDKFMSKEDNMNYCMEIIPTFVKTLYRVWHEEETS